MNKKVIVTGGAGFIGSHVVDLLIKNKYKVFVFDDLSTGRLEYINKKATFERVDITNHRKVFSLVTKIEPDSIFHLAAWPRIMRSVSDPIGTNIVNVDGTVVMLEAAKLSSVRRFVYSSSSSVYGDQASYKMREDFMPHPKSLYALQKLIGEEYCSFYAETFGMEVVSLRYFNVYGERQPSRGVYALVVGKFLKQVEHGEKMTVFGNGKQTRDYTYVEDIAKANLLSITRKMPKGKNIILNIGTSIETSVNDIANLLRGNPAYIIPNPRGKFEEARKCADISLVNKVLGWTPEVKFENGIELLRKK